MLRKNMPGNKAARRLRALEIIKDKTSEVYINTKKNIDANPNPREQKTKKLRGLG